MSEPRQVQVGDMVHVVLPGGAAVPAIVAAVSDLCMVVTPLRQRPLIERPEIVPPSDLMKGGLGQGGG